MRDRASWDGNEFHILKHDTTWNDTAGIYIFCGVNQQNQWTPLYISQTDSFLNRLPSHELWSEAHTLGATHVHAKVVSEQTSRYTLEEQLIQSFQPPLNTVLK